MATLKIFENRLNSTRVVLLDVVLLDPGPHRHDRTARGLCVYRALRI